MESYCQMAKCFERHEMWIQFGCLGLLPCRYEPIIVLLLTCFIRLCSIVSCSAICITVIQYARPPHIPSLRTTNMKTPHDAAILVAPPHCPHSHRTCPNTSLLLFRKKLDAWSAQPCTSVLRCQPHPKHHHILTQRVKQTMAASSISETALSVYYR